MVIMEHAQDCDEDEFADFFDFGWQNIEEPCLKFDHATLNRLQQNPRYEQLFEVLRNEDKHYNHIFIDWELLVAFVVFAFENVSMDDIRAELVTLSDHLNLVVDESDRKGIVRDCEFAFYDVAINQFLDSLRRFAVSKKLP